MKRSEINRIIEASDEFIRRFGFHLPPFADWTPDELRARAASAEGVLEGGLGWDVTDFGLGDFERTGLCLFTLRNGDSEDLMRGQGMCYAEKLLISRRDQITPLHRHVVKTEDIINRGGAMLAIEMFESDENGDLSPDAPVHVTCDGETRTQSAGDVLTLAPGASVTLRPGNWHKFWGEGGDVLVGEVSTVNDDVSDNVFAEPLGRFAEVEEDEPPIRLLVSDYAAI